MSFLRVRVKEDSHRIYDFIIQGIEEAESFGFPEGMYSPHSKAKCFKRHHPQYHRIPNSILRGFYKFGVPKSDGLVGLRMPKKDVLHIWGLGFVNLNREVKGVTKQITFNSGYELVFQGVGHRAASKDIVFKDYAHVDLSPLLKEDPIFRYLKVNGVFAEFGHKKACMIHDIMEHFEDNPDLTRKDLEKLGIKGDKLWDLVVNYQKPLDSWIRAGSKPKDGEYKVGHYMLSTSQHNKRLKNEWSISDHLNSSDIDMGKIKKQSFDSMVYEATKTDKPEWSFFN